MVKSSPTPKDTQEFQFKLHSRFKAFEYKNDIPVPCFCNLVATASRYGLIFFGSNDAYFQVIELKTIENSSLKDGEFRNYERRTISLPSCPYFLSVNCDCRKIAVVVNKGECPVAIVYDVMSFLKEEVIVINQIRLSASPNVTVIDVCWNPAISEIFSACKSDGTLGIYELKDSKVDIVELPAQACARSICWSPKGKQIAVGDSKGKITQYKPDLKVARIIQAPELNPGPAAVISLRWISNFQFIAWYNCYESNSSAVLMVVDAPKTGPISYTSFEDMDFRTGPEQSLRFYMVQLPQWNVLMLSNSNYTEVDVVAYEKDHWIQWLLDDAGRAELPLSSNHEDTYPIGMAVDTGSTLPVSFGESVLPPEPYLFLMSHHGLVVCFKVLNLINGAPTLCTPPDNLTDRSGIKFFKTTSTNANVIPAPTQQAPLGVLEENKNKPKENVTVVAPLPQTQPSLSFPANLNVAPSMGSSLFFPTTCSSLFTSPSQQQAKPKIVATRITTPIKKTEAQNTFLPPTTTTTNQQYSFSMPATTVVASNNMFAFEGSLTSQNTPSSSELFRHLIGSTVNQGQSREDVDVSQEKSPVTMTVGKISVEPEGEISSQEEEKKKGQSDLVVENVYESQEETEALVGKMVKEECELLQAELSVLRARANQINVKLGTDDEIARMIQQTDNLQEFVQEVTENSASQAIDVYQLKQSVIQGWIWYEEAQSRFAISRDPSMALIQRTQPLDPASKRQLDDIRQTLHYLDTQLVQASGALDERWELFQDSCRKTLRLKIPTLENVFQTMVKQNGVLLKQRYILKDISNRIQTFRSKSKSAGSSLVLSLDNVDALKQQLETLQLEPQSLQEMQYLRVMRKNERFTVSKIERLKSHLKGQKVKYVPAHKPQFSGSLAKTTNEQERSENEKQRKGGDGCKTLYPDKVTTLLGADVSPIRPSEKTIILNKNYTPPVQSTPKIDFNSKIKTTPTTITSFIFSPVTKTITYLQSQPLQKTTTFMFSPENNTTTKANQTVTVPTTNKVFVETSFTSQSFLKSSSSPTSVTTASSVPPIAQSSKIITFGTPPTITTTTSTIANSNSPKTTTAHDVFSDIFSIKKTTTAADTMKTSPWSSSFTFGSAFAPTTDNANVFAAKGGSLFAPAASVPTLVRNNSKNLEQLSQQPPSSSSAVVVNFKETPSANEAKSTSSTGFNFIPSSSPGNRSETAATTIVATSFSKQPFSFASAINVTPNSCDSNTTSLVGEQSKAVETVITSMPCSTPSSSSSSVVQSTTTTSASFVKPSSAPLFENGNEKTAATSSSSIFDGTKTSAVPAIPTAAAVAPSDFGSALEASQTPSFAAATLGGTPDKTETSQTIGTSLSIFGNSKVTTQANSAFQQVPAAAVVTTSTLSVPIMSTVAATQQSVLESQTFSGQSIFGLPSTTTTTRNVFGAPAVSSQNIFGAPAATTSQNIFANPTASTQSIFGPSSSSSQQSVFGAPTTTTAGQNVYGTSPIATTSSQSIFGGASSTSVQSIFGTASTTTTSAQSTLDAPTTNTTTTTTAVQSVFGAPSGQSVFGTTSIFGASSNTQQSSIFGSETAPVSTQSIFGTSSTFGSGSAPSSQSIFGSSVPIAATQSPFSFVSNVPSTTSTFGFDKKPVFGSSFGSTDTGTTSNANSFNFGSFNLDGGASGSGGLGSSPSSTFGQNQNPFAAKPSTEQKASVFGGGSSGGNLFGTPATTTAATFSSIFGGGTTSTFGGGGGGGSAGFDQSPSSSTFGSSSTPFGTPSAFGQSAFGTTNTFGTNQQQTGGVFTSSASPVSQTGFGFSQQTAKSAFGSAPVFGSSPAFGGAATFGSQPVFGGNSSNFGGGDSKVFGSTTPAPAFGSATQQQNSTFANMANQNIGFGTLVQQNPTTSAPTFSGGSSFSSWR